ncbi:anthocyanidin 3-O-glucosyltransferase 5-like [Gastrolobium bilobum]|uniref:anthocyanidin 3-O-glucosyltransferase 5-like n=1 Tax=Gastrolobium bilobum TaxID=150636 RepID=UPI002AB094D4|nr:anthocyanidin 3-O-glucosyltransferase 5-like [Gastrolobium bilobum]
MAISNSHHAALLSSPGMGHIIPILELAKSLVTHHIIPKVTLFLASIKSTVPSKAETHVLQSAIKENLFEIIQLPPLDITKSLGSDATIETRIGLIMHEIPPLFLSTISNMKLNPTILITDFFLSQVIPLAKNLKVPMYAFAPTNAWLLALGLYTPTLDKEVQGQYNEPISIPGCKSIHPSDLFEMLLDRTHPLYHEYLGTCEGVTQADGILVNTFNELEPKTLAALSSGQITKVPVYPIGPLIRETNQNNDEEKRSDVLDWLDKQEEESVIYVSFGSAYTMSQEQIKEMALGLELSGKKFVWSLRSSSAIKPGNEHYLTAGESIETPSVSKLEESSSFPEEFYRIQNNVFVIIDWAPQLDILKHSSIGGFVSHCGWNSVIESVSCGVPMVAWPLYAEQKMNAAMLAEEVGIAVRIEVQLSNTNMVRKEDIVKAIRKIMDKDDKEGCAVRKRVKELKHIAEEAWSHDGSSYFALSRISLSNGE